MRTEGSALHRVVHDDGFDTVRRREHDDRLRRATLQLDDADIGDGLAAAGDGKADFYAVVADYAFSKRTDVYLEIDRTRFRDSLAFTNGATSRVGTMVGVRHRF